VVIGVVVVADVYLHVLIGVEWDRLFIAWLFGSAVLTGISCGRHSVIRQIVGEGGFGFPGRPKIHVGARPRFSDHARLQSLLHAVRHHPFS
jgi:hypothetical protein